MGAERAAAAGGAAGLYFHFPFCSAICPYCDFYVLTGDEERRSRFAELLGAEIAAWGGAWAEPIDTLYFGGGTPSLLTAGQLAALLGAARAALPVEPEAPVFLEANPEDVGPESLAAWRAAGVSFLSLGVQSFDDGALRFLGRRHSAAEARRAVEAARQAGFATLSLDLIYGLPGQGGEAWRRDLEQAVALGPDHFSCYQLTVHEKTPFGFRRARGDLEELPEDEKAELFFLTHRLLEDSGYAAYEVSSFAAAPHHRSRHNRKYWRHLPYLGVGPSAHSFRGRRRWWNRRKLRAWQADLEAGRLPVEAAEDLTAAQLALEALMLGLRTPAGVDLAAIRESWGVDLTAANAALLDRLEGDGLLRREGTHLLPELTGLALADTLAARFRIPD